MPHRAQQNGTQPRAPPPTPEVRVPAGRLRLEAVIGRGSFATVYRAHHLDWGCDVAYKKLKIELNELTKAEDDKYVVM